MAQGQRDLAQRLRQAGESEVGSGGGVSHRYWFEQKPFKSLTNPESGSSETDVSLMPKFCCAGCEQIAYMSEIYQTRSFCVLILFFSHCYMESLGNVSHNVIYYIF